MKKLLFFVFLAISFTGFSQGNWTLTGAKNRWAYGMGFSTKDTANYTNGSDSILLVVGANGKLYYKYKTYWSSVITGGPYLPISDTATMLSGYKTYYPRTSISAGTGISYNSSTGVITNSSPSSGGTVTSVATNTGSGITGGTITSSGTIAADTTILSTKANVTASLLSKLNISDTAAMLANRLKISDTAAMLSYKIPYTGATQNINIGAHRLTSRSLYTDSLFVINYIVTNYAEIGTISTDSIFSPNGNIRVGSDITANALKIWGGTSAQFLKANGTVDNNSYLTTTGTGTSLTGVVKYTDTASIVSGYSRTGRTVQYSDTASMLSKYPLLNGNRATGTWPIAITGNAATATTATFWNGVSYSSTPAAPVTYLLGAQAGGYAPATAAHVQSFLGLGSYAYRSSGLAELSGATFTGGIIGTTATFSRTNGGTTLTIDNTTQYTQLDFSHSGVAKTNLYWDNTAGTFSLYTTTLAAVWTGANLNIQGGSLTAGSLISTGSITAGSFIKSGGTSSQYLMADGSTSTGGTAGSVSKLIGTSSAPTVALAGGVSGSVSLTRGTDLSGSIDFIGGTSTSGGIITVTFSSAYSATPNVVVVPANSNAFNLKTYVCSASTTGFTICVEGTIVNGGTHTINYTVSQ